MPDQAGRDAVPLWGDLVEKAGLKMSEISKEWDGSGRTSSRLRRRCAQGDAELYACGLRSTTVGPNDGNNVFTYFLIADWR